MTASGDTDPAQRERNARGRSLFVWHVVVACAAFLTSANGRKN
jgi:hypothetical protein